MTNEKLFSEISAALTARSVINTVEYPGIIWIDEGDYKIAFGQANEFWGCTVYTYSGRDVEAVDSKVRSDSIDAEALTDATLDCLKTARRLITELNKKMPLAPWIKEFGADYAIPAWLQQMNKRELCEDSSWHHDNCPTFRFVNPRNAQNTLVLGVHRLDPKDREHPSIKRFEFYWEDDEGNQPQDGAEFGELSTESEAEAQNLLQSYNFSLGDARTNAEFNRERIAVLPPHHRRYSLHYLRMYIMLCRENTGSGDTPIDNNIADLLTDQLAEFFDMFGFRSQSAAELLSLIPVD